MSALPTVVIQDLRRGLLHIGGGSNTPEPRPVDYVENQFFIAVSSGYDHSVFLTEMGAVYSCGRSDVGQCGSGIATMVISPNLSLGH